jgi:hypothetical protein
MSQQSSEPEVLRRRLSPERLHPYLTVAHGDLDSALALYAWNASGRVVAELSLGFWRFLLARHYDETLWRSALYRAFPGQSHRRVVHDAATVLHLCRNRVAHHEPIFNRSIGDIRFTALALADWICPVSRAWIERQCRIEAAWRERP